MAKAADLSNFSVKKPPVPPASGKPAAKAKTKVGEAERRLIKKTFYVSTEAAQQFEMLRFETGMPNPHTRGPALIAEALNLLFKKYDKPPIA